MDHTSAVQLIAIYEKVSAALNEGNDFVRKLPETEQAQHLQGLASVMRDLWLQLQLPVVREHRDLDPDGQQFQGHLK